LNFQNTKKEKKQERIYIFFLNRVVVIAVEWSLNGIHAPKVHGTNNKNEKQGEESQKRLRKDIRERDR
jgi:hypothetical protein